MDEGKLNWKWTVAIVVAAMLIGVITGSTNVTGQSCALYAIDDDFDTYFDVGRRSSNALDFSYEPDDTGDLVTTTLTLEHCSGTNAPDKGVDKFQCQDFDFDTDGNGIGDTNILDGGVTYAIENVGVRGVSGIRYMRVYVSGAAPSGGATPILTVCRRAI